MTHTLFASPVPNLGWVTVLVRLAAAVAFGGLIGWEREREHKHAGFRTHVLMSLAACIFTLLALSMILMPFDGIDNTLRRDPIRLIQGIAQGAAFMAAGTVFVSGSNVHGLTTGVGMWLAGAIGAACGLGDISLAFAATVLALVVLRLFKLVEKHEADPDE